ncbi:hypothetical protein Tco_1090626 [Tanacetum coccineum]|uniref:Uncharacterized protein n=1 Tax=Tanacetum coccineum TaxID=301880 RepID=A0ABQ5I6T6_9ASTR
MKLKEETFQVVLDALALTPCYLAFLITADVPKVFMHQFWNCIYKHDDFYRFKIDKNKRFKLTLEVFRDIFQIFPRVPGRNFDALPSEEDTISFLRDLGHTGVINSLNDDVIDQMHQSLRTFAAIINRSLLEKMKESKAYKTYLGYATGEVPPKARLKDTAKSLLLIQQTVSSSKSLPFVDTKFKKEREKEKVDVAHGKGIELLSEVALSEKAQMKESESESWGNDEDDSNNEQESSDESSKQENESEEQESDSEQDEESNDDDQEEEDHLDTRLGETRQEFMNFLSESLTARIKEQVKDQLPQILPEEVSNFAPPVIEKLIKESCDEVTLAKRGRKDKDKDEDPSAGSDRGLKKRKTSKDVEPTTEEPVFEVADSDMPQDQAGNLGDNEDEPRDETACRRDWFKKPTPPQEPTDPD